jgi:hypothetical protein
MSYKTSITMYTIQRAILGSPAIFVVLTSSSASFVANIVRPRLKTHRASVMGCISVQDAMQKDALAVVGGLWNPCSAGLCKFCMAIIIGQCARSKVLALRYLTKSRTGKFSLVHYVCILNPLTQSSGILDNNVTGIFESGIAIQKWRTEVKVRICHARGPINVHNVPRAVLYVTPGRSLMQYTMPLSCTARNVAKVIVSCILPRQASTRQKLSLCTKNHKNKVHGMNFILRVGRPRQPKKRY